MDGQPRLEVIDRDGWRTEFSLEKAVIHIGTDPRCDIILDPKRGAGVDSLHAQLITAAIRARTPDQATGLPRGGPACRLVNLGAANIAIGLTGETDLAPRGVVDLADQGIFKLGDFTLVFHNATAAAGDLASGSQNIGLQVSWPTRRLTPTRSLEATVKVSNLGDRGGVQIVLDLEGLPRECYEIEPGPVLFSGAEREVMLQLHHRGTRPVAGDHLIIVRATAPTAFPGEEASVTQLIHVLPFEHHKVRLMAAESGASNAGER